MSTIFKDIWDERVENITLFSEVSGKVRLNKLVVIYDGKMYKSNEKITAIYDEEEIYHLNAYQYISAEHIVFGKEKKDLEFITPKLTEERLKNREVNPVQSLGPIESKFIAISNKRIIHECNFSFTNLSPSYILIK